MSYRVLEFERNLSMKDYGLPKGANLCDVCLKEERSVPATHAVTDAIQTADGWTESAKRFGCSQHRVTSDVILLDGTRVPFEVYLVASQ